MENFRSILFDKSIYEINLLPQRSTFAAGKERLLSGTWQGIFREEFAPELLEALKAPLDDLPTVTVPRPLELQGYGTPQYVNVQYPFDGRNAGEIGGEIALPNPCMLYLRDFALEEKQPEKRYILNFKGTESAFFLYVNGEFAGYSENFMLDSEFDVSALLRTGSNRIGVLCFRYCSSTWLLDQDFFRFSGLTRDVLLTETDRLGVFDIDIKNHVDSEACTCRTVFTLTGEKALRELSVEDPDGRPIWQCRTAENRVEADFENLRLWSAEIPELYRLTVKTFRDDQVVDTAVLPFGFRELEIRDSQILVNGKRVIFNGTNRHEWNLDHGRSVTHEDMEFDVRFMKNHNINAVRTSHYPNHSDFYGLCDRAGLYMIDEACLESHGTQYGVNITAAPLPADDRSWDHICVNKLLRMYERDKNHPSVLLWSFGNESGNGSVFSGMREALLNRDPDVLIHWNPAYYREDQFFVTDVYSPMYPSAQDVSAFIEAGHTDKPYILCEFAHAMGNSLGDVEAYRALISKHPTFQGGFVWDFIDQLLRVDGKLCYGGDNLDKPNDRDFSCNGIIFADRRLADRSSKAHALQYLYQPLDFTIERDRITVKNSFLFRDTAHLDFFWQELRDGEVFATHPFALNVAPGGTEELPISLEESPAEQLIQVFAVQRQEEGFVQKGTVIGREEQVLSPASSVPAPVLPAPQVVEGYFNIGVTAGNASYLFAKANCSFMSAGLISMKVGDEEFLYSEPLPTVFRAVTSNDIGCGFHFTSGLSLSFSKYLRCDMEATRYRVENDCFTITYRYLMDPITREGAAVTYTVDGAGVLHVRAVLDPLTNLPSLPQFGIRFQLPQDKESFRYFGRGPFDNYPDRKRGCLSGIYESRCAEEFVPYMNPQECGNHEDVRWLEVRGQSAKLRFTGPFAFKYLQNSDFEMDNALHVSELPDSGRNHLTISGFTRGVGGDDSWWSNVHDPFTLPGDRGYEFEFTVSPVL